MIEESWKNSELRKQRHGEPSILIQLDNSRILTRQYEYFFVNIRQEFKR